METPQKPAPPAPTPYTGPQSGRLTYNGPAVIQNGEIVFNGLPPTKLRLTVLEGSWDTRLAPGAGNTIRLIARSKRPGTQKKCVVKWEVIP